MVLMSPYKKCNGSSQMVTNNILQNCSGNEGLLYKCSWKCASVYRSVLMKSLHTSVYKTVFQWKVYRSVLMKSLYKCIQYKSVFLMKVYKSVLMKVCKCLQKCSNEKSTYKCIKTVF